eukprot:8290946-Pyramimonas_sp.AAC.1
MRSPVPSPQEKHDSEQEGGGGGGAGMPCLEKVRPRHSGIVPLTLSPAPLSFGQQRCQLGTPLPLVNALRH